MTTYRQTQELLEGMKLSEKVVGCIKWNYAWNKNHVKLNSIKTIIDKHNTPPKTDRLVEYLKVIGKMNNELQAKNVAYGSPEYTEAANKVDGDFPDIKAMIEDHRVKHNEFLDSECDFEPYYLLLEFVPENMTPEQYGGISFFIKD